MNAQQKFNGSFLGKPSVSTQRLADTRRKLLESLQMFSVRVLRNKAEQEDFFLEDDVLIKLIVHYSKYDLEGVSRYLCRQHLKEVFDDEEYELILLP